MLEAQFWRDSVCDMSKDSYGSRWGSNSGTFDHSVRSVLIPPILSAYLLVTCLVPVTVGQEDVAVRIVRGWRRVDRDVLRSALQASPLCHPVSENADVDELFAVYDSVLRDIA